ncbi:glutamate receptor ionotropic, delta-2-like isoform X1 [Branchiostoma floridae x Branchiostoma belcheri]
MELQDDGIMDHLRSKWLEKPGKCMKHKKQDGVLRINNFKGVFIVLLLGITAGAIVGLFECFGHQCRKCIKKVGTFSHLEHYVMLRSLTAFLRLAHYRKLRTFLG